MAENQEDRSGEDLSDEISQHRLEDYRSKGNVAQSRELTALLALFAVAITMYALSPNIATQLIEYMRDVFRADQMTKIDLGQNQILSDVFTKFLKIILIIGGPICLAGFVVGVVGSFVQIGTIFSWEPLSPSLDKINPLKGAKKFISMKQGIEGIRTIFKTICILAVAYGIVKSQVFDATGASLTDSSGMIVMYGKAAKDMFLTLIVVLFLFAAFDFGLLKWEYRKGLRMTKQESKQEFKEREGDPQIKARIRAIQREVARKRMMQAVKKADVIITNPTHIAIAIVYDKDSHQAPKVVAKGADFIAQKIKKVAADAGIPLVENVPLARTLYKSVKVGQYVPRALYQAVAEVLAYVYRLKNRRF